MSQFSFTPIKIGVKVKDEVELLPKWLDHLIQIGFEPQDIIICDNMSTNPQYLDFLNSIKTDFTIVTFKGYCDNIHSPLLFQSFYHELATSCEFFMIIDADEFLFFLGPDATTLYKHTKIKSQLYDYLSCHRDYDFYSIIYAEDSVLTNAATVADWFRLLLYGHVIFNSESYLKNFQHEDFVATHAIMASGCIKSSVAFCSRILPAVLLHCPLISIKRRIRSHINKFMGLRHVFGDFLPTKDYLDDASLLELAKSLVKAKPALLDIASKFNDSGFQQFMHYTLDDMEYCLSPTCKRSYLKDQYQLQSTFKTISQLSLFSDIPQLGWPAMNMLTTKLSNTKTLLLTKADKSYLLFALKCGVHTSVGIISDKRSLSLISEAVDSLTSSSKGLIDHRVYLDVVEMFSSDLETVQAVVQQPFSTCTRLGIHPDTVLVLDSFPMTTLMLCTSYFSEGTRVLIPLDPIRPFLKLLNRLNLPYEISGSLLSVSTKRLTSEHYKLIPHILQNEARLNQSK